VGVHYLGCWMPARRYFIEAEPTDPRAVEALALVRTLYAVEKELRDGRARLGQRFTDDDAVRCGGGGRGLVRFSLQSPTGWTYSIERRRRRASSAKPLRTLEISGGHSFDTSTTRGSASTRGRRADHPAARRVRIQLAPDRRRRRVEDGVRAAERVRHRDAAQARPVVGLPRRTRSPHRPPPGCRPVRPAPRRPGTGPEPTRRVRHAPRTSKPTPPRRRWRGRPAHSRPRPSPIGYAADGGRSVPLTRIQFRRPSTTVRPGSRRPRLDRLTPARGRPSACSAKRPNPQPACRRARPRG